MTVHIVIPRWLLILAGVACFFTFEYFNLTNPANGQSLYDSLTPVPTPTLLPTPTPNITHGGTRVIPDVHGRQEAHQGGFVALTFHTTPHTRCLAKEFYQQTGLPPGVEITGDLESHGDSGPFGECNIGWAIPNDAPIGVYRIELIAQTLDATEHAPVIYVITPAIREV